MSETSTPASSAASTAMATPASLGVDAESFTVAVVGAGGKMGQRVSRNFARSGFKTLYCETSPAGQERVRGMGMELTATKEAVAQADVIVLAVPDVVLGAVSEQVVPAARSGAVILTLDPAAAYAGLLAPRADLHYAVAHPCHPSVFLERTTPEQWADTFGGVAAPQEVVAAFEGEDEGAQRLTEAVVTTMYAPVIAVHWVTVKQLAQLEPTLVETIACMVGEFLKDALDESVNTMGVPYEAARAMLYGHTWIALTNGLRGSNPFSDACHIAMDRGRSKIINEDWKQVFADDQLDQTIAEMLKIDALRR